MKNNYFKFIFLPILMIGLLFSFSACGDDEKDEVKDETLYQYEVQDFPEVVVEKYHLDGCWIEVSSKECNYGGKSKRVGNRICFEKMYTTFSKTFDTNDFSYDYNDVEPQNNNGYEGSYNAWSSHIIMPDGGYDYMYNYRMYYLFKDEYPSSRWSTLSSNWYYLNGIIHVHIVDKQPNSEDREWDEDYKIISYKGNEMTLRNMIEYESPLLSASVVDRVFRKFDIESVNAMLDKEKENLDKEKENL